MEKQTALQMIMLFNRLLPERLYNILFYHYLHLWHGVIPKPLSFSHPQTFNEKIIWLKRNQYYPQATILTDKYAVRQFIKEKIGSRYLVPLLGTYTDPDQIDFNSLPNSFVLKTNHGSGFNILVRSKNKLDQESTRKQLRKWMSCNYYKIGKEYQYKLIKPLILCESYMENSAEHPLIDYKVFCFSGKPEYIQVDLDRFTNHTRNFYDTSWNLTPFTTLYPLGKKILPRPRHLDEMLDIARVLSSGFIFARIDLYHYHDTVYFGEITLHHGGGFEPFFPQEYDRILGKLIQLPLPNG